MTFAIARFLTAAMLFLALGQLPYSYYTLLRWVVCGVSGYGACLAFQRQITAWVWTFSIVAVLFNPIAPIYLERSTWVVIDVVTALFLLASIARFRPPGRG